jgi:hypothetical protein
MLRGYCLVILAAGCSSSDPADRASPLLPDHLVDDGRADQAPASVPIRPDVVGKGGATRWFVMRRLDLGLLRRTDFVPDANAWRDYGFDLDARNTSKEDSKTSVNSCKRRAGSPTGVLADGNNGRDNNFGQHVMAVIKSLNADAEDVINANILEGRTTLLLRLDNVGAVDNGSVPGTVIAAGPLGATPKFDRADKWPTLDGTTLTFPDGYMAGGIWVSGGFNARASVLSLPLATQVVPLPLGAVFITFNAVNGKSGTIAGAANAATFASALNPMFASLGICPGNATHEQVVATILQSADLITGAPALQDTSRECDAISIGFGFAVADVSPPDVTQPLPPPRPDRCSP